MTSGSATAAPPNSGALPVFADLHVEGLSLHRSGQRVLSEVSFTVRPGEVLAIIGPNGAGKTTLLETIAGLRRPDHGRVRFGDATLTGLIDCSRVFSFMLDEAELPGEVRVSTLLRLAQRQSGAPAELTASLTERLGLRPLLDARATELSRGERRRVAMESDVLAKLRLARPDVQVLYPIDDAPAAGEAAHGEDYGRTVLRVGQTSKETFSSSRKEIITVLFETAGQPLPDWSQPEYPGYPLIISGRRRSALLFFSYLALPGLLITVGWFLTRPTRRRALQRQVKHAKSI